MIWRIREVLRFQTKPGTESVDYTALSHNTPIKVVARVELDSRLRRQDFQHTSRFRLNGACRQFQAVAAVPVKHEVVIVADAKLQLLVLFVNALARSSWLSKIEWRSFDTLQLAGRDQVGIDRRKAIGVDGNDVVENLSLSLPCQIEVGVVG